ncbi:3'(2'),5'-bisphosphate nucleotidase [Shewanella sp. OPT22]|nr:3'(2'),5'-bisphosphate nucleotidase [Shewanella sp. OPT22]
MVVKAVTHPQALLEEVITIATQAGQAIKEIYLSGRFEKQVKQDETPVTSADLAAHQIICDGLTKLTPNIPILSEEAANIPFSEREQWEQYWLVDPLDGTGEFIAGSGDFSVLVALVQNNKPIMGIVHVPMTENSYYAISGQGAFKRENGEDSRIHTEQQEWHDNLPLRVAVSRRQDPQSVLKLFDDVHVYELIRLGGAALKSCLVAEGQAHCYVRVGPTGEWDTGAAQVIIEEAGGKVMDINLQPLTYNERETLENPDFIVVGQPQMNWEQLLGAVSD